MNLKFLPLFLIAIIFASNLHAQDITQERPDWQKFFSEFKAEGAIVIADVREPSRAIGVYNPERAQKRYSPASTFKIPHTLFALDSGVLRDEFQVFKWDGIPRSFAGHNQDQTLRSAMRNSTIWVYEIFAKKIGEKKAKRYLQKIDYGNGDPTTGKGNYWLDGNLQITAFEQIRFLKKLYRNELPFKLEHQRLLKDVMVTGAGRDWIIRSKTGWDGTQGWWVGWIEWPNGPVFFALNMDTPNRLDDLYKREAITRTILQSIGALPAN